MASTSSVPGWRQKGHRVLPASDSTQPCRAQREIHTHLPGRGSLGLGVSVLCMPGTAVGMAHWAGLGLQEGLWGAEAGLGELRSYLWRCFTAEMEFAQPQNAQLPAVTSYALAPVGRSQGYGHR